MQHVTPRKIAHNSIASGLRRRFENLGRIHKSESSGMQLSHTIPIPHDVRTRTYPMYSMHSKATSPNAPGEHMCVPPRDSGSLLPHHWLYHLPSSSCTVRFSCPSPTTRVSARATCAFITRNCTGLGVRVARAQLSSPYYLSSVSSPKTFSIPLRSGSASELSALRSGGFCVCFVYVYVCFFSCTCL